MEVNGNFSNSTQTRTEAIPVKREVGQTGPGPPFSKIPVYPNFILQNLQNRKTKTTKHDPLQTDEVNSTQENTKELLNGSYHFAISTETNKRTLSNTRLGLVGDCQHADTNLAKAREYQSIEETSARAREDQSIEETSATTQEVQSCGAVAHATPESSATLVSRAASTEGSAIYYHLQEKECVRSLSEQLKSASINDVVNEHIAQSIEETSATARRYLLTIIAYIDFQNDTPDNLDQSTAQNSVAAEGKTQNSNCAQPAYNITLNVAYPTVSVISIFIT